MKKFLLLMMGLFIFSLGLFAEIPHSYVTENPDKEVTQTETLKKYKEKAELNLSVTKLNSEEIEGIHDPEQNKVYFSLDNAKYGIQSGDHIYVSEELQEVPSISTTNGRRKINGMLNQKVLKEGTLEYKITINERTTSEIEVSYSKTPKQVYIGILDKQYQIKKILKGIIKTSLKQQARGNSETILELQDNYNGEWIEFVNLDGNEIYPPSTVKVIKHDRGLMVSKYLTRDLTSGGDGDGNNYGSDDYIQEYNINGKGIHYNTEYANPSYNEDLKVSVPLQKIVIDSEIEIEYRSLYEENVFIRLLKYPKNKKFTLVHKFVLYSDMGSSGATGFTDIKRIIFKTPELSGISNLKIDETYEPEYIPFTSCDIKNQQNIGLEKSIKGVSLTQNSGKGLLTLIENDTLEINGKIYTIGAGGNLGEHSDTVGKINFTFKVENGNLRLRIDEYGLKINQAYPLVLKAVRDNRQVMDHTMNIKVPYVEKVSGESQLTIDKTYKKENILFDSCTLNNLKPISLINTVTGVTLNSLSGNGLLELQTNDILVINGQQHILSSNSLSEQNLNLGSIKLSYQVVSGKVQLKINGYGLGITQAQPLTIKLTRDNKEIMQHIINIKVPNIQKLVGESELSIIDGYNNDYMTIKGCTLENPEIISFVTPVTGTIITQVTGKGILKFEAGDILEINGVQSIVNSTGGVNERSENIGGISTSYKAQNGNLQIRIIDYPLNQQSPQMYNIKLYRKGIQVLEHTMKIFVPEIIVDNSKTNLKIRDEYKEEAFNIENLPYNVKGIEYMSGSDRIKVYTPNNYRSIKSKSSRKIDSVNTYFGYLKINGKTIAKKKAKIIEAQTLNLNGVTVDIQKNGDLIISLKNYAKKISKPFELNIESSSITAVEHSYGGSNSNHNGSSDRTVETYHKSNQNIVFYYVPSKVVGNSTLEVKEYYPTPEYIEFNSCTTPDPKPIALENSLRDVKVIQNSGNGLVNLENGDILELNGKEYHIGAGGNLSEQQDTLGEINFKFKVENGKLRLALTSWGVLEPDRILKINAKRESYSIMEHKMTIQSPRRVEGKASLVFNEKYPIREIIRFQGISLTAPTDGSLENPTPPGVTYKTVEGYGIPFMKEGDILEIITPNQRAVQKYTIDKNNGLNNFVLDLPGTTLSLGVNSGKLRLGLNNWLVNKDSVLNLRIVRGVNEICNMNLTLEVPKAPFDILKNGILDFGKVIQGSKNKKAETSILLDMHRDVSDVKFNLSTENPELINSNGKSLNARNLQAGVHKQGKNRYLVRVIGALDVPSDQELGVYRGSVLLNVTIK